MNENRNRFGSGAVMPLIAEPESEMAQAARRLIGNLEAQADLYANFLDVLNRQKRALINNRLDDNQEINLESEAIAHKLDALERERKMQCCGMLGIPPNSREGGTVKCEEIYPLLGGDQGRMLEDARDRLVEMALRARHALKINAALIQNARSIIHTTVGIVTSVVNPGKTDHLSCYSSSGVVSKTKIQVRSLINRKV